jgi:hypothetical protein
MGKHRTTITIPQDLKARMDSIGESINWSAVACRAFEQELAKIISQKGAKDMNDVITRLRASKQRKREDVHFEGFQAGWGWASKSAEADQLERLELMSASLRDDVWDWSFGTDHPRDGAFFFFRIIHPDKDAENSDSSAVREFWLDAVGDHYVELIRDSEYLRGFARGALDLWLEIKDQL